MPQLAEHAERHHRLADDFGVKIPQFVNRAAEPAELLFKNFVRERMLCRGGERFRAIQWCTWRRLPPGAVIRSGSPTAACTSRSTATRRCGFVPVNDLAQLAVSCGIVGLPDLLAGRELSRNRSRRGRTQVRRPPPPQCDDFVDAAALFVAFLAVAVEHDAVAGCQRLAEP